MDDEYACDTCGHSRGMHGERGIPCMVPECTCKCLNNEFWMNGRWLGQYGLKRERRTHDY